MHKRLVLVAAQDIQQAFRNVMPRGASAMVGCIESSQFAAQCGTSSFDPESVTNVGKVKAVNC